MQLVEGQLVFVLPGASYEVQQYLGRLVESSDQLTLDGLFCTGSLGVRVLSTSDALAEGLSWQPQECSAGEVLLVFDTLVFVEPDWQSVIGAEDESDVDLAGLAVRLVSSDLQKLAGDLLLAFAIANPGAVSPSETISRANGEVLDRQSLAGSDIAWAVNEASRRGWPSIGRSSFSACLQWLRDIPGFKEGVPFGPLGRSISALSQLLGYTPVALGETLFWAMIGLESLYTLRTPGQLFSTQLQEKVQILLGPPPKDLFDEFRKLYSLRSRFLHGDVDAPLAYSPYDAVLAFEEAEDQIVDAESLAIALLVSTLQAMKSAGCIDVRFLSGSDN